MWLAGEVTTRYWLEDGAEAPARSLGPPRVIREQARQEVGAPVGLPSPVGQWSACRTAESVGGLPG